MNELIKIPPMIAECMGLYFNALVSAREYARSIATDVNCDKRVRNHFISYSASLNIIIDRFERAIPRNIKEVFDHQVLDKGDELSLENVKALYLRMNKEQKQSLESCAEAILSGNFILEDVEEEKPKHYIGDDGNVHTLYSRQEKEPDREPPLEEDYTGEEN